MERSIPSYTSPALLVTPQYLKPALKSLLHTLFFHRLFPAVKPLSREVLGLTLPACEDADLESLLDERCTAGLRTAERELARQEQSSAGFGYRGLGGRWTGRQESEGMALEVIVKFHERKRKKTYSFFGKNGDEDVCWEQWIVPVIVRHTTDPASGSPSQRGVSTQRRGLDVGLETDRTSELDSATAEQQESLRHAAMEMIRIANEEKDHIPPITTSEQNPFPYTVELSVIGQER